MKRSIAFVVVFVLSFASAVFASLDGFISMKDGYLFDDASARPWVPIGIAYQTWNRPLGVWQTFDQIDYDLDEMVKMGANSIRVDFVWQHIEEDGDNQWKWENYDYLVQAAEERGIRIFALIGYQWPPNWFPDEWYTMHPPEIDAEGIHHPTRWQSDIINYEHPDARAQYAEWIGAVCNRYKDSTAVVGWIVGNEYGYLGLWSGLLDGYDPWSEQAFRNWCEARYSTIGAANAIWGSNYSSFDEISFVEQYRAYGVEGAIWSDMVQWREDSIAEFTALSALAAKQADTNHLVSYSTVGMQWGEEDWRYHAEDRGKITKACADMGAPLDFFSVNNYPWSILGHESQQGHWGISYTKKVGGVPVLYSETGFTSSETMWEGMNEERQGPLVRNSLWESLAAGAIGTHIFAWHDRPYITDREKGFGILYANRGVKPAYWVSRNTYGLMEQVDIHGLLSGSEDPKPDIAFLWTDANDSQYNRYECEMQQIAGALERLGYAPYFMDLNDLASGVYTNYKLIVLPRNMRVDSQVPGHTNSVLNFLLTQVLPAGIHVMASADLPGMQDEWGRTRPEFESEVDALFGIDASDVGGFEAPQRRREYVSWYWELIDVNFTSNAVGPVAAPYEYWPQVWKYNDQVKVTDGTLWATMDTKRNVGFEENGTYPSSWGGSWSNAQIISGEPWTFDGNRMLQLQGDAGVWKDFPVVPFGRYTHGAYLRSNATNALGNGAAAWVSLEWYGEDDEYLGCDESELLIAATPGDEWIRYTVDAVAPSNAVKGRRITRSGPMNLLTNGALSGTGDAPEGWFSWNNDSHDSESGFKLGSSGNSWAIWWDGGIWQDVTLGFSPGDRIKFGARLYTPFDDPLRNGDKKGVVVAEFYQGENLISSYETTPIVAASDWDRWLQCESSVTVPAQADKIRLLIRCNDASSGDGRFYADDAYVRNVTQGAGAVYVDDRAVSPAVVVKDHGTAKASIFLYSAGDTRPDGDFDGLPDVLNWKWRYEVFGAMVRDYFGIEPSHQLLGPNAHLGLADYRTLADGSTLWQIKNYVYDTSQVDGGPSLSFTLSSDLLVGKTVKAFEQGRILDENSSGEVTLLLEPDGMEMLHVYSAVTNEPLVMIGDAPAVIRPFGNKEFVLTLKYDTLNRAGMTLKAALILKNGAGGNRQVVEVVAVPVTGAGSTNLFMFIPDPDSLDPAYLSDLEGGEYEFEVWMEDDQGQVVGDTATQKTEMRWGVRLEGPVPGELSKGGIVELPVEWEELYEQLSWQNTPMTRNEAFPDRVAIFRSMKTESLFPGHLDKVNAVCDWLESMGYSSGNQLDVAFDNVRVTLNGSERPEAEVIFEDAMESTNGWTASGLWRLTSDAPSTQANCWVYNDGVDYDTGSRTVGSLTSPWISLSNVVMATFRLQSWYETENVGSAWDRKFVQVSVDDSEWTTLLQIQGADTEKRWMNHAADLSAYAGQSIRIRFLFDSVDEVLNQFAGWAIDNVRIESLPVSSEVVFADDMEATTNWTASGLWRAATNRAAGGSASWAYNDGESYQTATRNGGTLVSGWIAIPNMAWATLSFQSWYETEDTGTAWDRKLVHISTDGETWETLTQITGPMAEWTRESIDITRYAGRNVRIRFMFDTIDSLNNAFEGWYVDDVEIAGVPIELPGETGTPTFAEDVEAGVNGWTASGLWRIGQDVEVGQSAMWIYNNGVNYSTGDRSTGSLVSPWIDLAGAIQARVQFKSWFETEDGGAVFDRKHVQVSLDGTNWSPVGHVSGIMKDWTVQSFDISQYAGETIRIRFVFDSLDSMYNEYRGWFVDDIEVMVTENEVPLFTDNFSKGLASWTRVAGAGNWIVTNETLRAWRIGNDDNICIVGDPGWSNYTVSANIRYNRQGPYFNDAELYLRYQDRDNNVKVGIRNFHGFWRLKYSVRQQTNTIDQGWIHEFSKTNRPVEGTWYNLKVRAEGDDFTVYFDGEEVGSFSAPQFPSGRAGVGARAAQLGIWEPQKGYFFIDDDEYSYYSADESEQVTVGSPLNLDWGYLGRFFPTLVLPGVFVMSEVEAANVATWLSSGLHSLIATDGAVGALDENGQFALGRMESIFGAAEAVRTNFNPVAVQLVGADHYVTMDHSGGEILAADGPGLHWQSVVDGEALGVLADETDQIPALIARTIATDPETPRKVFSFNFDVTAGGQLTGTFSNLARRVFEWARGQAHKVRIELKYQVNPDNPSSDITIRNWDLWVLGGSGSETFQLQIPESGIMTGSNMYWMVYVYPWDASDPWLAHAGFYTSANDGTNGAMSSLDGVGLQILGAPGDVYGGRDWDLWLAYNTQGETLSLTYGIKAAGSILDEDAFDGQSLTGWTLHPHSNVEWSVTGAGALCVTSSGSGGYSYVMRDGPDVSGTNVTIEYDVKFAPGSAEGGVIYRGRVLHVNPQQAGWEDAQPTFMASGMQTGTWHRVALHIHDGEPYLASDLIIDGMPVFLNEPIESTNWTSESVGFLSPYLGSCEWDDFRLSDELYSRSVTNVSGIYVPQNQVSDHFASVPDWDSEKWEYDSSSLGAEYEWYAYFKGSDALAVSNASVLFAPRLMTEEIDFPTSMNAGDTVEVPVEWDYAPVWPARLHVSLIETISGGTHAVADQLLTEREGSAVFTILVESNAPTSSNYLWSAYIYPSGAGSPYSARTGVDDTYRYGPGGVALEPEVRVSVAGSAPPCTDFRVYADDLMAPMTEVLTWYGWYASFDAEYQDGTAPEGTRSFRTAIVDRWAGWGVYHNNSSSTVDLSAYVGGCLKLWVKSSDSLKIEIEAPRNVKGGKVIPSTGGLWQEVTIPLSEFANIDISRTYGFFLVTSETPQTFFVDDIRWEKAP